ncbi:VOC family protein [Streptomyces sannanensis]|uniref:VOC family protein n=1 Tax=Streptomyces sannanensis TaxID=285536 RepID=A0ABP6SJZ7_9ACTN
MLTTRFVTGSPNWIDLGTPDLDRAAAFYGGLFGWTLLPGGPEVGGYGMFQLGGRTTAGAMKVGPDQAPPAWTVYIQTPDADTAAGAVAKGGGRVTLPPMDVLDFGRMALFADPAGAGFGVWQPKQNKGLEVVSDAGSFAWAELYTTEHADEAIAFYESVFGWEKYQVPFPGGTYSMVGPEGGGETAAFGGVVPVSSDPAETGSGPYWLPYFEVADCDATVAKAEELGGKTRMAPVQMEGVGRFAKLADPFGARFAVIKSVYPEGTKD